MKTKLIPFDIEKAKNGAKIVTRNGCPARIVDCKVNDEDYPILGLVYTEGRESPIKFTIDGNFYPNKEEDGFDLFIEENEVEETDDYNPYKTTVESIADMVERYAGSDSDLQDFYDNIRIKCRDFLEKWYKKQDEQRPSDSLEIMPDKWYTCIESWSTIDMKIGDWFEEDHYYLGSDILKYRDLLEKDGDFKDYFHPWNISDVKDGDVLMKGEVIFIFNKMLGEWIYCHSSISYKDGSSINLNNCGLINNEVYPATKERRDFLFQKMKEAGYEWDPVKKELKKIEPKFHKGDWVIDKLGRVQKITDVRENIIKHIYEYNTISYSFDILSYGYFNENVKDTRLWNIKDAKDGDVLVSKSGENILIFKQIETITSFSSYYNTLGMSNIGFSKDLFQPATKEQCNLLFQKMKEAGYEWDSERKELKKIEYKDDMAEKEVKQKSSFNEFGFRRMTNQELSWWLRDHPEEHRECRFETASFECEIFTDYPYLDSAKDCEVPDKYYIRKNGREWQEPLVEI